MRILLVEDEEVNISSCIKQFPADHITIARTCLEASTLLAEMNTCVVEREEGKSPYDLILTDMTIPMGTSGRDGRRGNYSVEQTHASGELFEGGLVVVLAAARCRIPCILVSDSNGHKSVLGLMIEKGVGQYYERIDTTDREILWKDPLFDLNTRCSYVNADEQERKHGRRNYREEGKDWRGAVEFSIYKHLLGTPSAF